MILLVVMTCDDPMMKVHSGTVVDLKCKNGAFQVLLLWPKWMTFRMAQKMAIENGENTGRLWLNNGDYVEIPRTSYVSVVGLGSTPFLEFLGNPNGGDQQCESRWASLKAYWNSLISDPKMMRSKNRGSSGLWCSRQKWLWNWLENLLHVYLYPLLTVD